MKTMKTILFKLSIFVVLTSLIFCLSSHKKHQKSTQIKRTKGLSSLDFSIQSANVKLGSPSSFVAVAPHAGLIATANTADGTVSILDTLSYNPIENSIKVGKSPLGLAFSPDGNYLFTANSNEGTVSVIPCTATHSYPPYSFGTPYTIALGGAIGATIIPQQIAVSPDNTYVYVSVDKGKYKGMLAVLKKNSANDKYEKFTTIPLGRSPRGIAIFPDGSQIFVSNLTDGTISVINQVNGEFTPQPDLSINKGILGYGPKPIGLAIIGGTNQEPAYLMAACSGSNEVYVINPANVSEHQFLKVGKTPQQIALYKDRNGNKFAFISNLGDGTVSLIECLKDQNEWQNVDSPIRPLAGAQLNGISSMSNGGAVFVCMQNKPLLSVITLANYLPQQSLIDTCQYPTNVLTTSDPNTLLCWHNSLIQVGSVHPSVHPTGIYVHTLNSNNPPVIALQDEAVIKCVTHSKLDYVYAISKGLNEVNYFNIHNPQFAASINLPKTESGLEQQPYNLALSGNGEFLFVITRSGDTNTSAGVVVYSIDSAKGVPTLVTNQALFNTPIQSILLLAVNEDGSLAYITDSAAGHLWPLRQNGANYILDPEISFSKHPLSIALSSDGSMLYALETLEANSSLWSFNTKLLTTEQNYFPETNASFSPNSMLLSPDNQELYITDGTITGIRIVDPETLQIKQTLSLPDTIADPYGIAVSADGSSIYTANLNSNNIGTISEIQSNQQNRRMTVPSANFKHHEDQSKKLGDDPYAGFFMRNKIGDTPTSPRGGASSDAPDILLLGTNPPADLSPYVSADGYANAFGNTLYLNQANYIYIRGLNNITSNDAFRVWLYYIESDLALWPTKWQSININVQGNSQNYMDLNLADFPQSQVKLTNPPFVLTPPKPVSGNHYCLAAYVENPPNVSNPRQNPTDKFGQLNSWGDLWNLVSSHPNLIWRNTQDLPGDGNTWQTEDTVTNADGGGEIYIGVQCHNMPTDASLAFSVPGPDKDNTINFEKHLIMSSNYQPVQGVTWPASWKGSSIVISVYKGATPIPTGAYVAPSILYPLSSIKSYLESKRNYSAKEIQHIMTNLENSPNFRVVDVWDKKKKTTTSIKVHVIGGIRHNLK